MRGSGYHFCVKCGQRRCHNTRRVAYVCLPLAVGLVVVLLFFPNVSIPHELYEVTAIDTHADTAAAHSRPDTHTVLDKIDQQMTTNATDKADDSVDVSVLATGSQDHTVVKTTNSAHDVQHIPNELKSYMLSLINTHRAGVGLDPVILGSNPAAQNHADSMLQNCFSSHWGIDGLKPYMRYSLAGGYQSNAENVSGLDYCIKPWDGYIPNGPLQNEIDEIMSGLMSSPGHKNNILNPHHYAVNIGLAWDSYNMQIVQHFEHNYVQFMQPPDITDGTLTMSGNAIGTSGFPSDNDLGVQIYYDPTPHNLTLGQVSRTYCYDSGMLVTSLRPQLDGGWYYPSDTFIRTSHERCPDPYDIPPDAPAPTSPDEAYGIYIEVANAIAFSTSKVLPWTDSHTMTTSGDAFEVKADISKTIQKYGSGVYTIVVWGVAHNEDVVIADVALFYDAELGNTYHWIDDLPQDAFRGKLTRIVDAGTLEIDNHIYKLTLINFPEKGEPGYDDANDIVQDTCLQDSIVHIYIDGEQEHSPLLAQVWCGHTHLQTVLLDSGHVEFDFAQCNMTDLEGDWIRC